MATPSPNTTKIIALPKFSGFSEIAPIAAGAALVTAIPAPRHEQLVTIAAAIKPKPCAKVPLIEFTAVSSANTLFTPKRKVKANTATNTQT